MIEGLNAYELYLHEKKLSLERNARRKEEEKQRHTAALRDAQEAMDEGPWWARAKKHQVEAGK